MKKSYGIIVPLLAATIAVVAATHPLAQAGWYKNSSGIGVLATITTPSGNSPACTITASAHQCVVDIDDIIYFAFDSKADAEGNVQSGLLKYK